MILSVNVILKMTKKSKDLNISENNSCCLMLEKENKKIKDAFAELVEASLFEYPIFNDIKSLCESINYNIDEKRWEK
jgi:hypothetical protein